MPINYDQYKKLVPVKEDSDSYSGYGLPNIKYWRPGVREKDTDKKTNLETMPSNFDNESRILRRHIEALRAAKEFGIKLPKEVMDSKFLTAMLIQEGRSDFGTNEFDINNDKSIEVYNKIAPRFGVDAATFVAAVYDKGETAKRTKKPFSMVWNGTGVVRDQSGKLVASGENYANRFPMFLKAAEHPKNAPLFNFVDQYLNSKEYTSPLTRTIKENLDTEYQNRRLEAYETASNKLKQEPLRQLQYTFFGSEGLFGVPKEYDPAKMKSSIVAPNLEELRKSANPEYKRGGAVENTTHKRKII